MRIAIMGATSQIARDLVWSMAQSGEHDLLLFARQPDAVAEWLIAVGLSDRFPVAAFADFPHMEPVDAVLNFVGVGNPARAELMGTAILDITLHYDQMAMDYVSRHPGCRYLFLSSGAVYGGRFQLPVAAGADGHLSMRNLQPEDWYSMAKLRAECRHRELSDLPITDLRVFGYFSPGQDLEAAFLLSQALHAIQSGTTLQTSPENIVRDFLSPDDFVQLVLLLLKAPAENRGVDCYSQAPVDKHTLLAALEKRFGLTYEMARRSAPVITGVRQNYYSLDHRAEALGYQPEWGSLDWVLEASSAILSDG